MNYLIPLSIPAVGALLLMVAVVLDASSLVPHGHTERLGRWVVSVILLLATVALLIIALDYAWSRGSAEGAR